MSRNRWTSLLRVQLSCFDQRGPHFVQWSQCTSALKTVSPWDLQTQNIPKSQYPSASHFIAAAAFTSLSTCSQFLWWLQSDFSQRDAAAKWVMMSEMLGACSANLSAIYTVLTVFCSWSETLGTSEQTDWQSSVDTSVFWGSQSMVFDKVLIIDNWQSKLVDKNNLLLTIGAWCFRVSWHSWGHIRVKAMLLDKCRRLTSMRLLAKMEQHGRQRKAFFTLDVLYPWQIFVWVRSIFFVA